ncbi:C39 family peptidase [Thermaerobacillus caldiproteolyticus]|uniref:Uncharacterized protein YvpB n=1 Tax=Thermaerobacillus caldiproteolyticus TaxID=247480 RepID=A0A7V9Z521_9BACL|nr:C39 family peptidase [Anoxybacillus caldiproteolyticus]MBA2874174.1 uncharacterized protein YvpB [Anoxybacillus caldiproteolyticus]QPA31882.1 C39 family peptidase [Anoxybacillus caldiproteolyticus]
MRHISMFLLLFPLLGCSPGHDHTQLPSNTSVNAPADKAHHPASNKTPIGHLSQQQPKTVQTKQRKKVVLDVPLIRQNPELKYGCEVTSLAMVLNYAGINIDKMTLAKEIKKDLDPKIRSQSGDIISWGNPADGFVGDMTGKTSGYAVFDEPITELMEKYLPERAVNLTGRSFDELLKYVENKHPVVVWTTGDYRLPDRWESWKHGNQTIKTPLDLHVVVLVGFDDQSVYINDPLWGKKAHKVNKQQFIRSWIALQKRAVSYH